MLLKLQNLLRFFHFFKRKSKQTAGLEYCGQKELPKLSLEEDISEELIEMYLEVIPDYFNSMKLALRNKDPQQFSYHAHNLASAAGLMGFSDLCNFVRNLEHMEFSEIKLNAAMNTTQIHVQHTFEYLKTHQQETKLAK